MPTPNDLLPGALARFTPATRDWFTAAFTAPTPVQDHAWAAISDGQHTLVIAPTGSGKTLAAFLHAIDQLFRSGARSGETPVDAPSTKRRGTGVLYLSPIKALGADVERNLHGRASRRERV